MLQLGEVPSPLALKQLVFTACPTLVELLQLIELGAGGNGHGSRQGYHRFMVFVPKVQYFSLIHASLIDFQSDEIIVFGSFFHVG